MLKIMAFIVYNPYIHIVVGLIMITCAIIEIIEFETMGINAAHGLFLYSLMFLLRSTVDVFKGMEHFDKSEKIKQSSMKNQ